ncbi:exonuclease SbcC [Mesobacillus persicus]|uniref:Nuclease SbcCD subunit C n=1 Tax=Mesobacillus persicus TaxID=930146 RepID=A0A1H8EYX9_9BACI|nr:SMC family ATPase [Mesobacillus persicus]SEN24364.1 exonuclease SbcC [Mesobacillus persicus]
MKPLKLTIQAFGPYAGTEVIDFTSLENRTMFVVSGKTGSGKTTIFDGISYAIYGKASGEDRNGSDLRSQFAKDDLLTEISLDFSLRQKKYRIIRSPQQEKKKERGDGYTTVGAKAELYLIEGDDTPKLLAANVRDVDEKIKEIMIIDSNQFRQILMIPQGEFRKLLTSDSKDKEVILQRLFHTEIYKKVEERLKEEATELKKHVEAQAEERGSTLKRAHWFEHEELKEYIEAGSTNDALMIPLIKEEITAMTSKLETLNKERTDKQQERDMLQQKTFEAEAVLKQLHAMEELRQKKINLEGQQTSFEAKQREAQLAKKAALLESQEELCHRLKKDADQLESYFNESSAKISKLTETLKLREQELELQTSKEPERKAAQEELSRLEHIREDVKAYAGLKQETEQVSQSLSTVVKQMDQAEKSLLVAEDKLKNLQIEKEEIERAQLESLENERTMEKLEQELDKLKKYESHLNSVKLAQKDAGNRSSEYEKAEARLLDAKTLVQELEQTWLHSQASILARNLHHGEECPVCGSEHHPKLAVADNGFIPTEQDLKAAREQVTQLEKEKTKFEKSYYETDSNLRTLIKSGEELLLEIKKIHPDFDPTKLMDSILTIESRQAQFVLVQRQHSIKLKKLPVVKQEVVNLEKMKIDLQEKNKYLAENHRNLTIQYTEKNTTLNRMTESIPENLRSWQAFVQQYDRAVNRQEELLRQLESTQQQFQAAKDSLDKETTRAEEAEKRLQETKEKLAKERDLFRETMNKQGFDTYPDYHQAKRTDIKIEAIESEVRKYHEELRSVTDRLEEYSMLLKDVKKPDIEGLRAALNQVDERISIIQEDYQNLYIKKRENEQIILDVESINERIKTLEERYKLIGHLYEISKGQNTYRITFERFVLAAFLDDILAEANVRLAKMTSGRYRLLRKTDRSKGNVQSGLELLVFDQYTSQERHVKTLSGGESFKAALSLALGLADVVQNYSGGVSLETMFIDEGFGTLDPESLDQAIETLIDIQSSGRLVGIISHVPELKERIDARLEVIATQSGSKTEFYFLNG